MKTVSLVLGSGGARGLAHIGVIHKLEESGYEIRSVAGCSIGALIGGIYAAGKLDEYEKWVRAITKMDIVALMDISWGKGGLVKGDKIINTLIDLVGDVLIEDLPIPFTAVATDIKNEKEVWIRSGPLFDAIRASISLPLFFTPFRYNGVSLIDGGVLNPVPIAPTFGDMTDITIAVNLGGPEENLEKPRETAVEPEPEGTSGFQETISRFIKGLRKSETEEQQAQDLGALDIISRSFDTMQGTIARIKLAAYPPGMVIEIPKNACGLLAFDRAAEMIELGYERAGKYLAAMPDASDRYGSAENMEASDENQKENSRDHEER